MLNNPIGVYINWAAYDELSDNVELTEELAMRQLDELLRLRRRGVRLDYYLMDAFWFARDGGYRTWRKPHWPDGPDRWLAKCLANGVKPGLWVQFNGMHKLDVIEPWRESSDAGRSMCCFAGGYLAHFMETLHQWYERGVRMYKFDFASFGSAPPKLRETMLPSEIRAANISAFTGALKAFRRSHPEVVLLAYNGIEELPIQGSTDHPLHKAVDHRWLEVFDSLYCGDPRPADVPMHNFWRSKDVYSDHMVRVYEFNGTPFSRIDNSGFMIGTTGTCYYRGSAAWKGMLLLSLARGGWVNTYYGNLDLLDDEKAAWFAKAQRMFLPMQRHADLSTFGAMPGSGQPYGFSAQRDGDALISVVNPSQALTEVELPIASDGRVLFHDKGFEPALSAGRITLGPEQLAIVGIGRYASGDFDLGIQDDVTIPRSIEPIAATFEPADDQSVTATIAPPPGAALRVLFRQFDARGRARRTTGGSPPAGTELGSLLRISVTQGERPVPVSINYDKVIWSGLSWAVGEVEAAQVPPGQPLQVRCTTSEMSQTQLKPEVHAVRH